MEIKLVPASSLATDVTFDGKEFVSLDTLLSAFELDESVEAGIRCGFDISHIRDVQKRDEHDLLNELSEKCLGLQEALYSPIVTKDGWVYWVYGGFHCRVLETLALLYSNGVRSDSDFMLRSGTAWEICSLQPNTILHGNNYVPTKEDKKLFEFFKVQIINY
jgi:hypothetical protein